MEPLKTTVVPDAPLPNVRAGLQISAWLRQRDFIQRGLVVLAALALLAAVGAVMLSLSLLRQRIQILALAADGTVWLGEGSKVEEGRELQDEMIKLAITTLLSRGPKGFDRADLLPRLFLPETQALAEQLRQNEQSEFSERQWEQKPVVHLIETMNTHGASLEAHVTGHLVRTGSFGGERTGPNLPFALRLTFSLNRDLLRSRRYPWLVTAFTLTYDTPRP